MHIAVCSPSKETRDLLFQLFQQYQQEKDCPLTCRFFNTSIDLIYNLTGGSYDVIFFSDGLFGSLVKEIREKDKRVHLIRIAAANSGLEASGDMWYCLSEPIGSTFLFPLLDRLRVEMNAEDKVGLLVKSKGSVMQLPFAQIEYVEVIGRTVSFHLVNGTVEEAFGSLGDFEPTLLDWPDFIKVHRSYIVNLRYVQKLESGAVLTQTGCSVPVSKYLYPELRKDYLCRLSDPGAVPTKASPTSPPPPADERGAYRILLVDDEPDEMAYWSRLLVRKGCQVVGANCGAAAARAAADGTYDCVLLDVMLGDEKGFDLCEGLSTQTGAPVIFLSTKSDLDSQLTGFQSGGIDYITKDTEDELFWAKVEARIGRDGAGRTALRFGPLRIDLGERQAEFPSGPLTLTTVEFDLLWLLAQRVGEVCTPEEIYRSLWDGSQGSGGQLVQMQMSRLRRKLEKACPDHNFIETVWGEGYRFVSPDH